MFIMHYRIFQSKWRGRFFRALQGEPARPGMSV
jgi:hypothetical protein